MTRKPLMSGLDYVRDSRWQPRLFTHRGALQYMTHQLRRSDLRHAPRLSGSRLRLWATLGGHLAAQPQLPGD